MLPVIDDIGSFAIFLDIDGTLVELAESPDAVHVDASTLRLLQTLRERTDSALAVISGRDIDIIDKLLHPLVLPLSGVHGLRRRDANGAIHAQGSSDFAPITFALRQKLEHEQGVVIETKTGAVAVHYRQRPDLEQRCRAITESIVQEYPDLRLVNGKMVVEITGCGADKGSVIDAFLREPPFLGRTPIFIGDDLTDEAGFYVVNAREGVSIKVGSGATVARFRAGSVGELRAWLAELAGRPRKERIR